MAVTGTWLASGDSWMASAGSWMAVAGIQMAAVGSKVYLSKSFEISLGQKNPLKLIIKKIQKKVLYVF